MNARKAKWLKHHLGPVSRVLTCLFFYGPLTLRDLQDDTGLHPRYLIWICGSLKRAGFLNQKMWRPHGSVKKVSHFGATPKLDALLARCPS